MPEFGDFLLKRLNEIGLSQSEAARRGSFTRQSLGNWVNGHVRAIQLRNILALSNVIGVPPYRLLQILCRDMGTSLHRDTQASHPGDAVRLVESAPDDGSVVQPGQRFVATFGLQNAGTVPWRKRLLRCVDDAALPCGRPGDPSAALLPVRNPIRLPDTPPGRQVEVRVELVAPNRAGTVRSVWAITDEHGEHCFPDHASLWCRVRVEPP